MTTKRRSPNHQNLRVDSLASRKASRLQTSKTAKSLAVSVPSYLFAWIPLQFVASCKGICANRMVSRTGHRKIDRDGPSKPRSHRSRVGEQRQVRICLPPGREKPVELPDRIIDLTELLVSVCTDENCAG